MIEAMTAPGIARVPLEMNITPFLWSVLAMLHGQGYTPLLVGGCVRDALLRQPDQDKDILVQNITMEALEQCLRPFGHVDAVGRAYGILKLRGADELEYDFSVPRRDSKIGVGHQGFRSELDAEITLTEDAARRDFTINALLYDPFAGLLHDTFGGRDHLERRLLVATSDAFTDDPLRVLRGLQFSCRFGMRFTPQTLVLCRQMAQELATLPRERLAGEWLKLVTQGRVFDHLFTDLVDLGLSALYPELAALVDVPQESEWHPEGPVHVHVSHVLNDARHIADREGLTGDRRAVLMFAALLHDIAKPMTTVLREKGGIMRWTSHGHEAAGGPLARAFLKKIGIPRDITARVIPLVENHMAAVNFAGRTAARLGDVRTLAAKLSPANLQELGWVMEADHSGRPPLPPGLPRETLPLLALAEVDGCLTHKPRPLVQGRHVLPFYFGQAGPQIGEAVHAAYAAQIRGKFSTEEAGLAWLATFLRGKCLLLTGEDVLAYLGKPGPQVGAILDRAWTAQCAGKFDTREGALAWLRQHWQETMASP